MTVSGIQFRTVVCCYYMIVTTGVSMQQEKSHQPLNLENWYSRKASFKTEKVNTLEVKEDDRVNASDKDSKGNYREDA